MFDREISVVMANRVILLEHRGYLVEVDSVCVLTRTATDQCYLKTFPALRWTEVREERLDCTMVAEQQPIPIHRREAVITAMNTCIFLKFSHTEITYLND